MANHPASRKDKGQKKVLAAIESGDIDELRLRLTPRQSAFAEEFIVDHNGTAAVIRAGYAPTNASQMASQLLRHPGVRAYIDALTRSKEAKIIAVDPDYLISKVHEIILKEGVRDGDKLRALELLMKHKGMFIDRQEITGKDGGAIEVEQRKLEEDASAVVTNLRRMANKPGLKVVGE